MDLIEAYYAVSQDLTKQAQNMMWAAEMLAKAADQMSEQRMREKQPPQSSEGG